MKILLINDQFERGGAGRVASVMCNGFHEKGHDIYVVTDVRNWKQYYTLDKDIPILEIITRGAKARVKKWFKCIKQIRTYVKNEKPDIIISVQAMMFFVTWIACFGLRKKIIVADHTTFNRKVHPLVDFIRKYMYYFADGISILTEKDKKFLGKKFANKKVIYNPNSFDCLIEDIEREKIILCAGRLEAWKIKGFDIIIDVWFQICKNYPEWKLVIAGAGTQESETYLKEYVNNYHIENHVVFLGYVSDMKSLYAKSSIFVLSSRIEGFPMVLLEAMSQGCACMAFSIGGSTNEMMTNESGIICDDGDIDALKNSLKLLLDNEDLRRQYSIHARIDASKFSVNKFISEWESFIESTLSN